VAQEIAAVTCTQQLVLNSRPQYFHTMRAWALACFIASASAFRIRVDKKSDDYDCNRDGNRDCKDWDYGGAKCANGHKCEYRYKFGDMLLDHSCRCQSRCQGSNFSRCEPQAPTFEWSTTADRSHGPCSAHMSDLPIQVPLICTGTATGLKVSVKARGWLMSKLHLEIDGGNKGSKMWPLWPATRSWTIDVDSLAEGTHFLKYTGRFFELADIVLQGNGGQCSFDNAPNYDRALTRNTYSGLNVLNRLFGDDADWPEAQKQQLYFATETVGKTADGSIDATVTSEGWWTWLYEYSQVQASNDPWGNGGRLWEEARDFTPWPRLDMGRMGRVGQNVQILEPCNTLSNLAYQEAAVWMTCKVYPFTQEEYASLQSAFVSLAAGSAFLHASGTSTGGRADTFTMDWLMLQQYQIMVKKVVADAGSRLSAEERNAILYFGRNIGDATDIAKNLTQLFSGKYDHAFWNQVVRGIDVPAYEMPIAGIVCVVLWSLEGKFPIPGLDSLLQQLIDALTDLFNLPDVDFLKNVYTPAVRKALSFSNLHLTAVLPVLETFLKFLVTFVEALVFQEKQIPVPKPIRDVWGFFDQLGFSSDLLADMKITWEYYNGFNCRARSDHTTWHEKASYGLIHSMKLAQLYNEGVGPTSNAVVEQMQLPDELIERDPAAMIQEMDTSGDGLLSQDEIHRGVQKFWYVEKDVESFDQQFVPFLAEVFPLADKGSDGKLNVEEVGALLRVSEQQTNFEKDCERNKKNGCTAHPLDWYQDSCSKHGNGFVKVGWEYCGQPFSGRYLCRKTWTCAQSPFEDDCCSL